MAPRGMLLRADAASEKWAFDALAPLLRASCRAVYPLPVGGATQCLLLPARSRERALRVTHDGAAHAQAAALRVAFLQLAPRDATAAFAGEPVLVEVTAPEELAAHALVVVAPARGKGTSLLWVFSDDDIALEEHATAGRLIVEAPMSLEAAAAALLAGVERACPAREAARLRSAGGPRPEVSCEWTQLRASRVRPATPGAFEAAVGAFAAETRAGVAAAAARAIAQGAQQAGDDAAADDDGAFAFSYDQDDDGLAFGDGDDGGAWGADEAAAAGDEATPRATRGTPPGGSAPRSVGGVAASSPPLKRASPSGGQGSAFARRRQLRADLGLTPVTGTPAPRRKRIFGDATPAEAQAGASQDHLKAFDTPRGAKRARRPKREEEEEEEAGAGGGGASPQPSLLLSKLSHLARWVVGMN